MKKLIYQKKEKRKNINKVYRFISQNKFFTKKEISDSLNLSFPTVTKIINLLLEKKIVREKGFSKYSIKRKATLYEYNPNSFYSIGIKLELSALSFIIVNLGGEEIKKIVIKKDFFDCKNISDFIIENLKIFIKDFKHKNLLVGIGISIPGIVDSTNTILKIGTNFNIFNKNLKVIEKAFDLPVHIINEANAGVIGEFFLNKSIDKKNIAFISIDSGIGAGIIIDDSLYSGSSSQAGEIGHLTVEGHGRKCICGNEGCLEMYCSNRALVNDFKNKLHIEKLEFSEIFTKKLIMTAEGKEILDKYTDYLSYAIKTLLLLLDLDKIIIGGLIANYQEYIIFNLEKKVFNNNLLKNREIVEFSIYGDYSNLIGAAFLPFNSIFMNIL